MNSEEGQAAMSTAADHPIVASLRVPAVVRVYGTIVEMLNTFSMALGIILTLVSVLALAAGKGSLAFVWHGLLVIAVSYVFVRLGRGLTAGYRMAVYAWCVVGGLPALCALGAGIFVMVRGEVMGLLLPLAVCVIYAPPIVSAFRHWSAFKTGEQVKREAAEEQQAERRREEERREHERQEQEAREQQRVLYQKYPCSTCSHFVRTGIIDRFKGKCTKHGKTTYTQDHCSDHSSM